MNRFLFSFLIGVLVLGASPKLKSNTVILYNGVIYEESQLEKKKPEDLLIILSEGCKWSDIISWIHKNPNLMEIPPISWNILDHSGEKIPIITTSEEKSKKITSELSLLKGELSTDITYVEILKNQVKTRGQGKVHVIYVETEVSATRVLDIMKKMHSKNQPYTHTDISIKKGSTDSR